MLELIQFLNTKDKRSILQDFNPDNNLWITTDVKSQFSILNELRKDKSSIKDNCVIRAIDFWTHLLSKIYPKLSITSRSVLTFIYHEWAQSQKQEWQKTRETGNMICQYMEVLAHLLHHPLKDHLIKEWKHSNKKETYWIIWYHLATEFWNYLSEKKIIESSWVSAFLLDEIPYKDLEFEEIIFDLGFDINNIEVELIQQIATKIKTKVLVPTCINQKKQNYIHFIYNDFKQKKHLSFTESSNKSSIDSIKMKKFATPLAEIKDITYHITHSLKKGIQPNKIYILAPHIEKYWTCLKSYCKKENIPVNKSEVVSLHNFPVVQLWLAKMWTHLSIIKYENLETIQIHQNPHINFSQLKSEFYNIKRIENWPSYLYTTEQLKNKNKTTSPSHFINWALKLLPNKIVNSKVHKSIKECLNDFAQPTNTVTQLKLKWQTWLSILELLLKKKEIEIHEGNPNGINCLSFNALGWVEPDFTYIAGLSEQNLKTEKHTVISSLEAQAIMKDLGFLIKNEPTDIMEQTISHFILQGHKELVLSFSSTDFLGTPLNPSCLWLEKAIENKKDINHFDIPHLPSWDQQQRKSSIKGILAHHNIKQSESELINQSIQEDLGNAEVIPFFQNKIKSLSPSSLNDYIKCPFIFAAKKIFYLWDGPDRDMDIPPTEHGSIAHKLFELLQLKQKKDFSRSEILQIIESIKQSKNFEKTQKIHPIIWEKEKKYLLKKAMIFLEKEEKNKSLFNNYQTIACEKKYQCYWSFKEKSLATEGDILFKGKIDRIDSNNEFYHIVDYKSSFSTGSVAISWAAYENFQMAFYLQILERGLADLPALSVKSALYLNYKNFNYQGLVIKEPAYIELLGNPKKKSLVSEEKKESIIKNVNQKIDSRILNIHRGKFSAQPKKRQLCTKCRWRKICRASHLN